MLIKNIVNAMATILGMILLITVDSVYAGWQGPIEVVSGGWGKAPGQFGIEYGDSGDNFPRSIGVTKSGRIVIADPINEILHTFNSDGSFLKDIVKPVQRKWWPYSLDAVNDECAVVGYVEYTHTFNVATGELVGVANNMGGADYVNEDCSKIYSGGKAGWKIYSPTGQLIKTSTTRPLELGQVKLEKRSQTRYKITLTYPDKVYGLSSDREFVKYVRTSNDKVYGVNPGGAWRFNQCGKLEGFLLMPEGQQDEIPGQGPEEPQVYVHSEYGEPVVAPNGDIYTWNYTPDAYKILKWTWVDDPNVPTGPDAPSGLTVTPSLNGLYLTWTASPQDPGCVTGYEVARATTSGGVYSTIGTVDKGVVKYNDTSAEVGTMYYYKVRAKAGSEYSPYTAEVSGKR